MSIKKSHEIKIVLDDYGDITYDANFLPFKEYESYGDNEKLSVLYAIQDLIQSNIESITIRIDG